MKIAIDLIKVEDEIRIRKEIGNLLPLMDSISKVGLINPILIDEESNLVAGFRRLEACRKLGMEEVDVRVVEFGGDAMKMFDVEVAENFFRKDFTNEEVLATEKRRQELIEAARKKGVFERSWQWLKNVFAPKPEPMKKSTPVAKPPAEQAETQTQNAGEKEPGAPAHGMERTTQQHSGSGRDDRSIKWRTS